VGPLVLLVELSEHVEVDEPGAGDDPLRGVALLLGLRGEEDREGRVAAADDGGDLLALQLGDDAGRLVDRVLKSSL